MTSIFSENRFNIDALKATTSINARISSHLKKVYTALAGCMIFAVIGAIASQYIHVNSPFLTSIICIGFALWLSITPNTPQLLNQRRAILAGFAFFQGFGLGPFLSFIAGFDSNILPTAFLGTVAIFTSFSLSAFYSENRFNFWVASLVSSGASILFFTSLFSFFLPSVFTFNILLYLGLFVFSGYVLVDTQFIIFKAAANPLHNDELIDALNLFVDFVAIFVRIVVLLSDKKKRKN